MARAGGGSASTWWARIGFAVQLTVLSLLTWQGVEVRLATAIAVESAVLHNFYWHQRFTWRDSPATGRRDVLRRLVRFNATNGAISLTGNVALMHLLVHVMKLPVLPSNVVSLVACSLVNFLVSDRWVWKADRPTCGKAEQGRAGA